MRMRLRGARVAPVWMVSLLLVIAVITTSCGDLPATSAVDSSATPVAAPSSAAAIPAAATPAPMPAGETPVGVDADGNFYRGNPDASVWLVEFSDFQCPYCGRHSTETEPALDQSYISTGQVLHIFRNFPLDFHPNAMPAAIAAYCAGQQAPKLFWDMHDWLFANQASWSELENASDTFRSQAISFGADGPTLDACTSSSASQTAIEKDRSVGASMGVAGTPAFFVNDWFISGAVPFAQFQQAIENAKQGLHPTPAAPTPTPLPEGAQIYDVNPNRPWTTYDGSPTLGAANARLILIAFEDFKCGYCAEYATTVEPPLRTKYVDSGQMRIVFKILPIYAPQAGIASLCASDQNKFWEFHDLLFSKQAEWQEGDSAAMIGYAEQLGLDKANFEQCIADAKGQMQLNDDQLLAEQLGIRGTPYFLLLDTESQSGLSLPGALPLDQFELAISNLLNPPTPTPAAQ